jgi:hypothetical protein
VYIQQDAKLHISFISGNCSTCFGWYFYPSSGAYTTVSTASGICHTVTAICRYRGRVVTGLSVLWVAYATHSSCRQPQTSVKPEAAITVFELLMMRDVLPKHVEQLKKHENNKFYYTVASCWLFRYDLHYNAQINEHQVDKLPFYLSGLLIIMNVYDT